MKQIKEFPIKPDRLLSLDAFRGIAIAGMILVNSQSGPEIYYHLDHGRWNDWTSADFVFPFFLFVLGAVIPISFAGRLERGADRDRLLLHIFKRALIIFTIGLFINAFPYFAISSIRIPGVLQRIALCYFFVSIITMTFSMRGQAVTAVVLLVLYWIAMKYVPVPGYGYSVLNPGENLAAYIDNLLLFGHMYEPTWDPEGLFSTIPAISTTLFGVLAGHLLRSGKTSEKKVFILMSSGLVGLISGLIMDIWFPINKLIWSSSYVVFTGGAASMFLAICYWLIDVKGYRRWSAPFVIYGMNALAVYVLSVIVEKFTHAWVLVLSDGSRMTLNRYMVEKLFATWTGPVNASLFYSISFMLIWLGLAALMYRKKIFIKI